MTKVHFSNKFLENLSPVAKIVIFDYVNLAIGVI